MHTMEAWRLKIEPWRVCSPVVADSHHFDEKQDPDPHYLAKYIRIRIQVIRNPAKKPQPNFGQSPPPPPPPPF
jgi:hypothetical protein